MGDLDCSYESNDFGEQRARVADIARRLAALDRGEDRPQPRAGIAARTRVAPQPGEVRRCAQFEQKRFLAPGDVDGLDKTGFGSRRIRLRSLQRDPASRRCNSATQNCTPDSSTNAKASFSVASAVVTSPAERRAAAR
jgi:hypothetical protein